MQHISWGEKLEPVTITEYTKKKKKKKKKGKKSHFVVVIVAGVVITATVHIYRFSFAIPETYVDNIAKTHTTITLRSLLE